MTFWQKTFSWSKRNCSQRENTNENLHVKESNLTAVQSLITNPAPPSIQQSAKYQAHSNTVLKNQSYTILNFTWRCFLHGNYKTTSFDTFLRIITLTAIAEVGGMMYLFETIQPKKTYGLLIISFNLIIPSSIFAIKYALPRHT